MKNDLKNIATVFNGRTGKMLCLIFSIVFITGCVTTEEKIRMQLDINTMKADVAGIKKKSKNIETQFPDQKKQFSDLEDTQRTSAKIMSDLLVRIQYLTTEVQTLTGRFEEARYHSEKNSAELKESKEMILAKMKQLEIMSEDLKKNLARPEPAAVLKLEPGQIITGAKGKEQETEQKKGSKEKTEKTEKAAEHKYTADDKKIKKENGPEAAKDSMAVKDAYMAAYVAYKEDRTVEAREKFRALLMDNVENEYSDNARFWIAESYYKDGSFEDAILAYEELFKKNPESDKVPGAMLKQGFAFYALNDSKTGRIILEKLVDKFPESDKAKLATKKMNKATIPPKKK